GGSQHDAYLGDRFVTLDPEDFLFVSLTYARLSYSWANLRRRPRRGGKSSPAPHCSRAMMEILPLRSMIAYLIWSSRSRPLSRADSMTSSSFNRALARRSSRALPSSTTMVGEPSSR